MGVSVPNKVNLDNIKINRDGTASFPNSVAVVDESGVIIFVVDKSWTDAQIMTALKLANHSFDTGEAHGMETKAEQIRVVL